MLLLFCMCVCVYVYVTHIQKQIPFFLGNIQFVYLFFFLIKLKSHTHIHIIFCLRFRISSLIFSLPECDEASHLSMYALVEINESVLMTNKCVYFFFTFISNPLESSWQLALRFCAVQLRWRKNKLFQLFLTTIDGLNPMSANIWHIFSVAFENEIDGTFQQKKNEQQKN